jgi:cystathionine gamma-lyase
MGFAVMNSTTIYDKLFYYTYAIGPVPSPFDSYLVLRSLKTLSVRMERIGSNALKIAKYLETRKDVVERVLYPGLKSHPNHKIAMK